MAAPSGITFREVSDADIPLPAPGKFTVYGRGSLPRVKDSLGNIFVLGNGIESIAFVNTVGLVDNYLITLQDGTEVPFTVTNAKSITTIAKVGTTGLVDTYRISFNNGAPVDFTVTNARSIVDVEAPANPGQPGNIDEYQIVFNDGPNDTFIVYNGTNGQGTPTAVVASPVGNTGGAGTAGPEYANPDHVHAHGNQTNPEHHAVATTADNGFMSGSDKTKLDGIQAGAEVNQNAFSVITGNTGTASADAKTDSLAITGGTGISTVATDTPDGLVITNTGVTQFNGRTGNVTPQQADYDQFFTTTAEAAAAAPVQNFNGRTGNITPQQADYDAFFTTPAEAAAVAPVQSFNGRQGAITPAQADYDQFFTTPAEAAAAAPVQTVNGQTGNVTIDVPPVALQSATAVLGANVPLPTTNAQVALVSVSLAPGTWLINAHATFTRTATVAGKFSIMVSPNATVANAVASSSIDHPTLANVFVTAAASAVVNVGATTTYTLFGAHSAGATTNLVRSLNQLNAAGATRLNAVRIA